MASTCSNLTNKTVTIPDCNGKLSLSSIISNWQAVRAVLNWILGFMNFCIPGKPQCQVNVLNGQTEIVVLNPNNYTIPTDNSCYCFFDLSWNGQLIAGGDGAGMNTFTLDFQWYPIIEDGVYKIKFLDVNELPKILGSIDAPCTIKIKWTPQLRIGTYFCTTLVETPTTDCQC